MALYRLLFALLAPLLLAHLVWGWARGRHGRAGLAERLGGGTPSGPRRGLPSPGKDPDTTTRGTGQDLRPIWVHAASNGELASARALITALCATRPILVTTNTPTAQVLGEGWALPGVSFRLAPLDSRIVLARFLRRHDPCACVIIENELWPNRIDMLSARAIPVFAFGARLSEGSARNWARTGIGPRLMRAFTGISAQDAASERRFLDLGLPPARLLPRLNLKTAVQAAPAAPLDWPRAETVLAASTHEGEEEQVLDAYLTARTTRPGLRLILAPRHPRRAEQIAALIAARGLAFTRRSRDEAADAPVFLADTMGEMANWYESAGLCFTGGSLVDKGGHTPFEPAAHGCAILHGPHVSNAAEPYRVLDAAGGALRVADGAALATALADLDAAAQGRMVAAMRAALAEDGATEDGVPARIAALARHVTAAI